jgi:hypothetical protein
MVLVLKRRSKFSAKFKSFARRKSKKIKLGFAEPDFFTFLRAVKRKAPSFEQGLSVNYD